MLLIEHNPLENCSEFPVMPILELKNIDKILQIRTVCRDYILSVLFPCASVVVFYPELRRRFSSGGFHSLSI